MMVCTQDALNAINIHLLSDSAGSLVQVMVTQTHNHPTVKDGDDEEPVNNQVSDPPKGSGHLPKVRKLDRDDPALILSYNQSIHASPVQWSNFKHIMVL